MDIGWPLIVSVLSRVEGHVQSVSLVSWLQAYKCVDVSFVSRLFVFAKLFLALAVGFRCIFPLSFINVCLSVLISLRLVVVFAWRSASVGICMSGQAEELYNRVTNYLEEQSAEITAV